MSKTQKRITVDEKRGLVEMQAHVDSTDTDRANAEERAIVGKGFTLGRSLRKIANIDEEELNALYENRDGDAIDFIESGGTNKWALKKLLARFPQWRCSEGQV